MNTSRLETLVGAIVSHRSALEALAFDLRTPSVIAAFDKWSRDAWCRSVAGDALVRMRLFTEQNFTMIETMSVVAVARYSFELAVWLRLFAVDRAFGLVYFDQLIKTQLRFYRDTVAQLEREIVWLRALDAREAATQDEIAHKARAGEAHAGTISEQLNAASDSVDMEAARRFSLYADAARTNGYGFQAYLVEKKLLPTARQAVIAITAEQQAFRAEVPPAVQRLCPDRWQWRQMAVIVEQQDQYDYIYAFASKLLHATPASITTDKKNLEMSELVIFLRYIEVTIRDMLSLAAEYRPQGAAG
jgi:hypothetical protein